MIRICDHFYKKENFKVAAQVGEKFLEKFESHKYACADRVPHRAMFLQGQDLCPSRGRVRPLRQKVPGR